MTIQDIIKETGHLPQKAELENGQKVELFIRKKTRNKGYIATMWLMYEGIQHTMIEYGEGKTVEAAKDDLKSKILKA